MTPEHIEKKTVTEILITPEHRERNTAVFHKSVNKLKKDGNYKCFVSNRTDELQVHHIAEFSLENVIDFDRLKAFLMCFDPYGYSCKMSATPIINIDDVRNLLVLHREYHNNVNEQVGNGTGIHNMTWPAWVAQCVCNRNENPVPGEGETIEQVKERVD